MLPSARIPHMQGWTQKNVLADVRAAHGLINIPRHVKLNVYMNSLQTTRLTNAFENVPQILTFMASLRQTAVFWHVELNFMLIQYRECV